MMNIISPRRVPLLVLGGILTLLTIGCGRSVGTVTGKVTYQGKALKGGNVMFVSEGDRSFSTSIKEDGTYTISDLMGGTYKVCVETASLKPPVTGRPMMGQNSQPAKGKGGPPPGSQIPEGYTPSGPAAGKLAENKQKYVEIPSKYAEPASTDLSLTFKGGTETFNIDLK